MQIDFPAVHGSHVHGVEHVVHPQQRVPNCALDRLDFGMLTPSSSPSKIRRHILVLIEDT